MTNIINNIVAYDICQLCQTIMFVAYDVCRIIQYGLFLMMFVAL